MMATETKEEALALLRETRREIIAQARQVARRLIIKRGGPGKGRVTSRDVIKQMVADGVYRDMGCDRWMGAVFLHESFTKTGATLVTTDDYPKVSSRRNHAGPIIQQWTLVK